MKTTLPLASLMFLSLVAAADTAKAPTPPPPPPPGARPMPACEATGDVLFEIDHKTDGAAKLETSELVVYATGAWTLHVTNADGKPGRQGAGCLSPTVLKTIRTDLDAATWKINRAEATCAAISAGHTEFRSHGKLVWTERMCQLEYLDETSRQKLAEIQKLLDAATASQHPPCCKK